MRSSQKLFALSLAGLGIATPSSKPGSLWVTEVPNFVRPYAIQQYNINIFAVATQAMRLPITGPSSGGAFTLQQTAGPATSDLGVLPHIHPKHHENFYSTKGRFQLWTEKGDVNETRIMTKGDYGAVVQDTTHTYQFIDPDTSFSCIIFPGGFEDLYYYLSTRNGTYPLVSNYDPLLPENTTGTAISVDDLQRFDVVANPDFVPRRDQVNGAAPAGRSWHNGTNNLPNNSVDPFYIANDFGPKYLNTKHMGYHIVQPIQTPITSQGNFTISKVSLSRLLSNQTVPDNTFSDPMGLEMSFGQLNVKLGQETISMLEGDVLFVPANTTFQYWSEVAFTSFMHFSTGSGGLGSELMADGEEWDSPVWPTYGV